MRFQGDKPTSALFIQDRRHLTIALPCGTRLRSSNHPVKLRRLILACESRSLNSSRCVAMVTQLFMDGPLAAVQKLLLAELRKDAKPGRRTDLTSGKMLPKVDSERATAIVGRLFNESGEQVKK